MLADTRDSGPAPALMSLPELARYLGMAERTIYDWAQSGRIPAFKLGAAWRFRRSEIDAWLETQRSGPDVYDPPIVYDPIVEPVETGPTLFQERQALLDACRREIEATLNDPDRTFHVIDQFRDEFSYDVLREVVAQLQKDGLIEITEVKDRNRQKTKVMRRRK